jgi:ATP-dependent helicase/nuclease subunit A
VSREGDVPQGWFQVVRKTEASYKVTILGQHADWEAYEAAEKPYLEAEQDRLLYVAATRPREMLVVSRWTGTGKGRSTPAWDMLAPFLQSASELAIPPPAPAAAVPVPDCSLTVQVEAEAARTEAHARAKAPSWSITSVTAEARHIAKMARAADPTGEDDVTRVVVPDTASHRADAGAAWGTLIHGLLEHAMRHERVTRADLRRLALWLTVEKPQLRAVLDEAVDTAIAVSQAEFWAQAKAAEHSVETPFMVAGEERGILTGVIDLLFRDGDGWRVVDYKTDVAQSGDKYGEQLAAYQRALDACAVQTTGAAVQPVRIVPGSA